MTLAACNACHTELVVHGGSRKDPRYCVMCHNDQRKYGNAEATVASTDPTTGVKTYSGSTSKINGLAAGDLPAFLHRLHTGEGLTNQGYNYGGILFNEVRYPQSIQNCTTCHTSANPATAALGDNWKNVPSRMACGACHDSVDWVKGTNHAGGPMLDDVLCTSCHGPAGVALNHVPVTPPNATNAGLTAAQGGDASNSHTNSGYVPSDLANLPAGAHWFKYDISKVYVDATKHPVFVFRFLQDGLTTAPVVFNTWDATANGGDGNELITNWVGSTTLYFAYAVPQDGIAAPKDWNATVSLALRKLWRGGQTGATLTGPDASGYYTATFGHVTIPATATLRTGGIGYSYGVAAAAAGGPPATKAVSNTDAMPLTQINLAAYPYGQTLIKGVLQAAPYQGGVVPPSPNMYKMAGTLSTGSADTARRPIVENARCNTCHKSLGIFTEGVFHAGQRNDAPTCTFCHHTNTVGSTQTGFGINIKTVVHAIHAGSKRVIPFTWEVAGLYWEVGYPGVLNNCEACHVPGSYDFSASTNAGQVASLLWDTNASGAYASTLTALSTTAPFVYDSTKTYTAPWITPNTNYGSTLFVNSTLVASAARTWPSMNTASSTALTGGTIVVAAGGVLEAEPATLVTSPITAACVACHDSNLAKLHIAANGGVIAKPRSTVVTSVAGAAPIVPINNTEQCLLCHGNGKVADIRAVHMTF